MTVAGLVTVGSVTTLTQAGLPDATAVPRRQGLCFYYAPSEEAAPVVTA
jgi:hypothetical protein